MAKCPFAVWMPLEGSSGPYVGGHPFKVVHHTTEGATADGAFAIYRSTRNIPHFTVDDMTIYQHADTDVAVSALRHPSGGTETNRSSAVQIELVGFAGRSKSQASLNNMARLCRWIEVTHNVPQIWPNGHPKPAVDGRDPGGHNRNQENWETKGGHFGHCHVPDNVHWDPAYTDVEVDTVMRAVAPASVPHPGGEAVVMVDHGSSGNHTGTEASTSSLSTQALKAGLQTALRMNEIGGASPYRLSFAGKGKSGASFGYMQGDLAAGQSIVQSAFRNALAAAGVPSSKITSLAQRLSVHLIDNPLTTEETTLVNNALNVPTGRQQVDAMDENIFEDVRRNLDHCVAAARVSGREITPKAQIYMLLWINMTGPPTTLLTWLSGHSVTMAKQVAQPGPVVDGGAMESYLSATPFYTENPGNLPHIMLSAAAGANEIAVA